MRAVWLQLTVDSRWLVTVLYVLLHCQRPAVAAAHTGASVGPEWWESGFIPTQPVAAGWVSRALASAGLTDGCSSDSFLPFVFRQAGK